MKLYGARRVSERAVLKAEYEAGASIRTIASAYGHSYGYVHDALVAAGTQLRSRGGPNNPYPFRRRANRPAPHPTGRSLP
ncbi:helix-turn-helix domain-containing protein [Mycobacteroides abscessus]|uniref:helix-turn-helix domain-containing protein n=1 Tax=Mycobacteroides abscessus TaxID=36809 RepID=UPI0009A7EC17|nr:helix-turn-helix domain-containing protein [Mycobacteroides abscessus]